MSTLDQIHKLMNELVGESCEQRTMPEYLELIEKGEEWVKDMRKFFSSENK